MRNVDSRVSASDQNVDLQRETLGRAGSRLVYEVAVAILRLAAPETAYPSRSPTQGTESRDQHDCRAAA